MHEGASFESLIVNIRGLVAGTCYKDCVVEASPMNMHMRGFGHRLVHLTI